MKKCVERLWSMTTGKLIYECKEPAVWAMHKRDRKRAIAYFCDKCRQGRGKDTKTLFYKPYPTPAEVKQ